MQDKIFKVKIFEVTHKSVKSMKVFSLKIFRLYGILQNPRVTYPDSKVITVYHTYKNLSYLTKITKNIHIHILAINMVCVLLEYFNKLTSLSIDLLYFQLIYFTKQFSRCLYTVGTLDILYSSIVLLVVYKGFPETLTRNG